MIFQFQSKTRSVITLVTCIIILISFRVTLNEVFWNEDIFLFQIKRFIENPVKHLRWGFLRKLFTAEFHSLYHKRHRPRCSSGFWIRLWNIKIVLKYSLRKFLPTYLRMSISFVYATYVKNPLKFVSFNLKGSMIMKKPLSKICQKRCFLWPVHTFLYKERISDSVIKRKNAGQRKPLFSHNLCSEEQEHLLRRNIENVKWTRYIHRETATKTSFRKNYYKKINKIPRNMPTTSLLRSFSR